MSRKKKLFDELLDNRSRPKKSENGSDNTIKNASINVSNSANQNQSTIVSKSDINNSSAIVSEIASTSENALDNRIENVIKSENAVKSENALDSNSTFDTTNTIGIESEMIIKINTYRKLVSESEKKKMFHDIYDQQNVYIDKNLVKAVDKMVKQRKKKKKDIYNEALQLYFDIVHGQKIELKGDEK